MTQCAMKPMPEVLKTIAERPRMLARRTSGSALPCAATHDAFQLVHRRTGNSENPLHALASACGQRAAGVQADGRCCCDVEPLLACGLRYAGVVRACGAERGLRLVLHGP